MSKPLSIRIGHMLYKHFYPIYNLIYPIFKNRQDAHEISYLRKLIKPGDTVIDIGANIGFYSKIFSECVGEQGQVHLFEPDVINFKHLVANTKPFKNLVLNNKAVSDKAGVIKVYKSKDLNVDHRTYPIDDYESIDEIQAISIDDYVNGSIKIDFIKMDIQGFETSALKGMEKTIKANPNIKMLLEFWPYGLNEAGNSVAEYYAILKSYGLKVNFLENETLIPFDENKIPEFETWAHGIYKNILVTSQ
jgi:FkbM family methyltransferase